MGTGSCLCSTSNAENNPISTISIHHPPPQQIESQAHTPATLSSTLPPNKIQLVASEIRLYTHDSSTFESLFLKELNQVRQDPKSYSIKLSSMLQYIIESNNTFYFVYPNTEKIILKSGKDIFLKTINHLQSLDPLPALTWSNELKITLKEEQPPLTDNKIGNLLIKKRREIKDKYSLCTFLYDFISNPIVSVIFQLTDEAFDQNRRDTILSPLYKNFAIVSTFDPIKKFVSISSFA